jgi:hypothetical protein
VRNDRNHGGNSSDGGTQKSAAVPRSAPPRAIRAAGALVALEGLTALVAAIALVARELMGRSEGPIDGWGTAVWFLLIGAGVFAGGLALVRGKRWGRAIAIVAQLLLLPVVWSLLTASHQPLIGSVLAVVVVGVLGLLVTKSASRWLLDEPE